MGLRILRCNHCGNIIIFQEDSKVTPVCCGEKMQLLDAGSTDASAEKHVPIVIVEKEDQKEDNCTGTRTSKKGSCATYVTVKVGAAPHPMVDSHYIQWILLETNLGTYTKFLEAGDQPEVTFCLGKGEKINAVYEYCNMHGLWVNKD